MITDHSKQMSGGVVEYLENHKGFKLSEEDEAGIRHVAQALSDSGPDLRPSLVAMQASRRWVEKNRCLSPEFSMFCWLIWPPHRFPFPEKGKVDAVPLKWLALWEERTVPFVPNFGEVT
jgi:hypothetical protein